MSGSVYVVESRMLAFKNYYSRTVSWLKHYFFLDGTQYLIAGKIYIYIKRLQKTKFVNFREYL